MVPEEASKPGPDQPESIAAPEGHRPARRPGRGHRGRGRRRPPRPPQTEMAQRQPGAIAQPEPLPQAGPEAKGEAAAVVREFEQAPEETLETRTAAAPEPIRSSHSAAPATVQRAIEEVNQVIDNLRDTLDDMEEVLEMLEVLERQGTADERELESLRRALRQTQRPRESGQPHRGRG